MILMMTIWVLKFFTSFSRNRLFFMPASVRAFLIKISPLGEISYKKKRNAESSTFLSQFTNAGDRNRTLRRFKKLRK